MTHGDIPDPLGDKFEEMGVRVVDCTPHEADNHIVPGLNMVHEDDWLDILLCNLLNGKHAYEEFGLIKAFGHDEI